MVAALARCNRAEVWLRTGVIDAAVSDAEVSRDAYARIGSSMEAYAHCILGDARREQGRSVQARVAFERALDLAEISGDPQSRVHALIGLSRVLADTEPQRAHEAARLSIGGAGGRVWCAWAPPAGPEIRVVERRGWCG